ncbi:PLP-dependent cysteine synthase family protein [Promethearchaeum syntrophicum]|uniref:PLP-dependent cysteine synthase family protein n=1 Tax=Promethearchaeum syntrophicum TaxID=2594042 RepID=A0A5B9DD79_9ARCH|nr:cysteine synthase family protein [Candidatus Prometheoarchaeum syntrophicum]QEE16991.1 cysteine synthase A [Candidatus Prometheoarchaeum syntrophicum]
MKLNKNILETIGNTSLVQLHNVANPNHAKILVKLEMENPTGSMKDRMAQAMINEPEKDGRLKKGDTIIEYTGGSTGASLALVCTVKEYKLQIVTSDAFSQDKIEHMKALGAEITIVPSHGRGTTKELIEEMIETARKMSKAPNIYWTNQFNNKDALVGYYSLAEEIWEQTHGQIDAFVHSVGTAVSIKGTSSILQKFDPTIKIVAVEPKESPVLSGGSKGAHNIEGIGSGFIPPLWETHIADQIILVSTEEAIEMSKRLAREEGIFAGISSGANVVAALQIAKQLGPSATVVTLMVDSGLKYLNKSNF